MSYTLARNLRVNKKTGVISGEFAESNVTDLNGRHCYSKSEDIYNNTEGTRSPEEKYSRFIYGLMIGDLQGALGKFKPLSFGISNYYEDFGFFQAKYPEADPYILTYRKYKNEIENILNSPKKYTIKLDNIYFLKRLNEKSYSYTILESRAGKFSFDDLYKIKRTLENMYQEAIVFNIENKEQFLLKDLKYEEKLPLEIEKYYKLNIPNGDDFKEISEKMKNLSNSIDVFSKKDLDAQTIKNFYNNQLQNILRTDYKQELYSLFAFGENKELKDGFRYVVQVYPELIESGYKNEEHKNPNFYISYKMECLDIETSLANEYSGDSMAIDYLLDDENRTKQVLLWTEQQFIQDLNKEKDEESEEESL